MFHSMPLPCDTWQYTLCVMQSVLGCWQHCVELSAAWLLGCQGQALILQPWHKVFGCLQALRFQQPKGCWNSWQMICISGISGICCWQKWIQEQNLAIIRTNYKTSLQWVSLDYRLWYPAATQMPFISQSLKL